jgi:hypothetical protein
MIQAAHCCHVPGCDEEVPPDRLMCRPHWYMVPAPLRRLVWYTYRSGRPSRADVFRRRPLANLLAIDSVVRRRRID